MFQAKLSDPVHGKAEATAATAEAAVEQAFRELAMSWMHEDDARRWSDQQPMFDGEINEDGEVWWDDRSPVLLGTVRPAEADRVVSVFTLYDDPAVRAKLGVMTKWEAMMDDGRNQGDGFGAAIEALLTPRPTYRVTVERVG